MDFSTILNYILESNDKTILLLPIGPPGSGKTTFKNLLIKNITNRLVITPSRDDIFYKYRIVEGMGLKKCKHLTHTEIKTIITKDYPKQNTLIYIDTTNSNNDIRQLYINLVKPNITKFICFHTKHLDDPTSYLFNRVYNRKHPTFPKIELEQLKTINTIYNNIDYPDNNDCFNIYI